MSRLSLARRLFATETKKAAVTGSQSKQGARTTLDVLKHYPQTRVSTLPNGLRVATEPGAGETATIGVYIDTGSRYESAETSGVAHYLEHLFFKGTTKRTRTELEVEVENIGGHLNAYTSREQTVFYAKVLKGDIPRAVEILSDILTNSKLAEESVERERSVILREMHEIDQNLEEVTFDRLHETAYRGCSMAFPILGPSKNIERFTRRDILDYINTHYTAPRMVIAGSGPVDHEELVKISKDLFGKVPSTPSNNKPVFKEPAIFTGSDLRYRYDDMEKAYIAIGYPTCGWNDPDSVTLMVIQALLGGYDKETTIGHGRHHISPMVAEIAEQGTAHSVMTFNTQYSDTGLFGVYAVSHAVGQDTLMWNIQQEMARLAYDVCPLRLEGAKEQLKNTVLHNLDGSTQVAEEVGRQLLTHGRRIHPLEMIARIDAVDEAAIKHVTRRFIIDRDHALAATGPILELPDYLTTRRRSCWTFY